MTRTLATAAPPEGLLAVDLGGTHARFARLGVTWRELRHVEVTTCSDHAGIEEALAAYLAAHPGPLSAVCLAAAGPVDGDVVALPNSSWTFRPRLLEERLGAPLVVMNDFSAQALALDLLEVDEVAWLGEPRAGGPGSAVVVVGPGTGLGVALRTGGGEVLPSEAGHVTFAPADAHQIELLRILMGRFGRLSVERLASGPGIVNLYRANRCLAGLAEDGPEPASPRLVVELAEGGDTAALRAIEDFFDVLASFAGDMALAMWARGGVYLSGGVVRRLAPRLDAKRFRERFQAKGRFAPFCASVPLGRVRAEEPGLVGCAAALAQRMSSA